MPRVRTMTMIGVGLILALSATGCGRSQPGGGPGGMAVHVVGFAAARQPIEERVSLVGTLQANEAVEIRSELDGTIEEIAFQEGQWVTKGDVLVRIDQQKLQAGVAEAQARLRLAESTLKRYEALAAGRAVSQQEVAQAMATFESERASLALMNAQLEDATIAAPFDGIVSHRRVSAGQFIAKGAVITSLIDPDPMKAEFRVPERYLSQMGPGQRIQIAVAAYPQERFSGEVYFIDPQIEEITRTVLVKALLPNGEDQLRSGMFANLSLIMQARDNALVIPETALTVKGNETSVFVVDPTESAQPRLVKTGVRLAGLVEILEGLSAGETVVIEGTQKLSPGAKVVVRFEEPGH